MGCTLGLHYLLPVVIENLTGEVMMMRLEQFTHNVVFINPLSKKRFFFFSFIFVIGSGKAVGNSFKVSFVVIEQKQENKNKRKKANLFFYFLFFLSQLICSKKHTQCFDQFNVFLFEIQQQLVIISFLLFLTAAAAEICALSLQKQKLLKRKENYLLVHIK